MKPPPKAAPDAARAYERLVATLPAVERKGAANPYTALNGNMFSILSPGGVMGLRLAPADRDAFLAAHGAKLYEAYGAVMKEYVAVPPDLLADIARMTPHMAASYAYALTLKPKATTRKKA